MFTEYLFRFITVVSKIISVLYLDSRFCGVL